MGLRAAILALAALLPPALGAQEVLQPPLSMGQVQSLILTIDADRLFADSRFGRRVNDEFRAATEALAAENREIEARLNAEEQDLTDRRAQMEVNAFRLEAAAFDARVQTIRSEQDAKERALPDILSSGHDAFAAAAAPVLADLMRSSGAVAILDRRTVFLALDALDVTDEAIAAIDAVLGDGTSPLPPGPGQSGQPAAALP
ncbi:MAG: OmpH family outer membrane protein [Rubellimicrobium sp.]|nr:OmpH family outer membrane protein [Rubellimicrobium sp.]